MNRTNWIIAACAVTCILAGCNTLADTINGQTNQSSANNNRIEKGEMMYEVNYCTLLPSREFECDVTISNYNQDKSIHIGSVDIRDDTGKEYRASINPGYGNRQYYPGERFNHKVIANNVSTQAAAVSAIVVVIDMRGGRANSFRQSFLLHDIPMRAPAPPPGAKLSNNASAQELDAEDLIGVWADSIEGTYMDIRPGGAVYFFKRTITEDRLWMDGLRYDIPLYEIMQTDAIIGTSGNISQNILSIFNRSKMLPEESEDFDNSDAARLAVVMRVHNGAFALPLRASERGGAYNRDYWSISDGVLAIKGHLFDVSMNGDTLEFFPFSVCAWETPNADVLPLPKCRKKQVSWKKSEQPGFAWKRVDGELLAEYKAYSMMPMLRNRHAGDSEANKRSYRLYGNTEIYEDILDQNPDAVAHPFVGPMILAEGTMPGSTTKGNHRKLQALLDRGYGRWLSEQFVAQNVTACEFYIQKAGAEATVKILRSYCSKNRVGSDATASVAQEPHGTKTTPGTRMDNPTAAPLPESSVAESRPAVSPQPKNTGVSPNLLVGCWKWSNGMRIEIQKSGSANNGFALGTWKVKDNKRYTIAWPDFTGKVSLSADGQSLSSVESIGTASTADRLQGDPSSFVGSWRWDNGGIVTIAGDGIMSAGLLKGSWSGSGKNYNTAWPIVDAISVGADGKKLSGQNQFGSFTATKIPGC